MSKLFAFHTNINELLSLDFAIKAHIYAKDLNSMYLETNLTQAMFHGYMSPKACCQRNLQDFPYSTSWNQVIADDQTVMQSQTTMFFIEQVIQSINQQGISTKFLSVKTPLFDQHKSFKGIFGISFYLQDANLPLIMETLNNLQLFTSPAEKHLHQWGMLLTAREKNCAYYLTKGFSAKEIANHLTISSRTVETHIENIKKKLGCLHGSNY